MFYDKFILLCKERNVAPTRVLLDIGLSKSAQNKWAKGAKPGSDAVHKLADYFNVSTDYLLDKENENTPVLTEKDERDIEKHLAATLKLLEDKQDAVSFMGEVMTDADRELLAMAIRYSMEIGKTIAKQKYTPKKYRKE